MLFLHGPSPSEYQIRKEPKEAYVSTIEALAHVLGALEENVERFKALLVPFRAMIDMQIDCEKRFRGGRIRKKRVPEENGSLAKHAEKYANNREDWICVVGEANAWPYRCAESTRDYPDEPVHWVAERIATGERFDRIIAPRYPLGPNTTSHIGLSEEELASGALLESVQEEWRAFVRDTDVVCSWGTYSTTLFASSGGYLPKKRLDLRQLARLASHEKVGPLAPYAERLQSTFADPMRHQDLGTARGRARQRINQLTMVAHALFAKH